MTGSHCLYIYTGQPFQVSSMPADGAQSGLCRRRLGFFDYYHQKPGPLGQNPDYAVNIPTRNHIHSMIRTPNGNDYGKSLLQKHLPAFNHVRTAKGVIHWQFKRLRPELSKVRSEPHG